jgi:hypothetical protein
MQRLTYRLRDCNGDFCRNGHEVVKSLVSQAPAGIIEFPAAGTVWGARRGLYEEASLQL